ncbi:hypothetical protein [Cellulomonas sp. ICMP 17802]|uniref:hypothetical protein n=1 Tax=Cellulomonas sp. ICMP 17802 TaxID=3239199 RepID=UPI00351B782F
MIPASSDRFRVRPWSSEREVGPPDRDNQRFDLLISACGFEARSAHVHTTHAEWFDDTVAVTFPDRHELSYHANRAHFEDAGVSLLDLQDRDYSPWLQGLIFEQLAARGRALRIMIDISSLSRSRMAAAVETVTTLDPTFAVECVFAYSPSTFTPPPPPADMAICQPVSPYFAGFSAFPGEPPTLIVGVGYEPDRALGIAEYLEPGLTVIFRPVGIEPAFDSIVANSNALLYTRPGVRSRFVDYPLADPFALFASLESVVSSLQARRPTLVPMGPKPFALAALLAAALHLPDASVWRVSPGEAEQALEREALGPIVGISVDVPPRSGGA